MKSSDTSRSTGPRQRLSASLDRQEGARSARDRTLIIAPPAAVVYLKKLIRHLSLPGDFTLVDHHLSTPGEFMVQANQHHQHSGPFRRIFALLDLPEGEPAFKQFYKGVREQIRYHDIGGSCLFRALFSRPDFSLWQSLHTTIPEIPSDPSLCGEWSLQLSRQGKQLFQDLEESDLLEGANNPLDMAIRQAQRLARIRALRPNDQQFPFTEVHELIVYLLRIRQRAHPP